jgi:hypothetical protein
MAGIDLLNQFPKSKMAGAAKLGQSYFRSSETVSVTGPALKSGSATMASVNGTTSTATLLALCGLTTSFSYIMFTIVTSAAGVAIAQSGNPAVVYPQGSTVTFSNVSTTTNQLSVMTASADVVTVNYEGT